jgi:hypothetical protein
LSDERRYVDLSEPPVWGFYYGEDEIAGGDNTSILKECTVQDFSEAPHDLPEVLPSITATPTVEGQWTGHSYLDNNFDTGGMIQLEIGKPDGEGHFKGRGYLYSAFTLEGMVESSDAPGIKVTFTKFYEHIFKKICEGTLDGRTGAITGRWHYHDEAEDTRGPLRLVQMPPSIYQFRYTDAQFVSNPATARWAFACAAVLHQVRQQLWSWKFMKARCVDRKRFVHLWTRSEMAGVFHFVPLTEDEEAELRGLRQRLPTADHLFYRSIGEFQLRKSTRHV